MFPPGHYYSPEPDREILASERGRVWKPLGPDGLPGVDLDLGGQRRLLRQARELGREYRYPDARGGGPDRFHDRNPFFSGLDSRMLFVLLRLLEPRRMVEIGSGHSSLLAADVNVRFLDGAMELTCVDPFPQDFLRRGIEGITAVVESRVELLDPEFLLSLRCGDFLFIDSSHVIKTGNDVAFLYLQILPRLAPGVLIHVHDIFLPDEYPEEWVLSEGRSWNEQYLLQALLVHSCGFRVLFGSHSASRFLADEVDAAFGELVGGGSLWIERIATGPVGDV